ncbi:hypothetical protein SBF1_4240002 [Candidatus Desulfosporosinus infrequens]|uniref:Uncharacterized protein n=1 Tax=Candidatus Desulfosporosinus infrequens TaxID=2043169 RepID=A0A2U3LAR1_9FIRM|nr:hypothetical protein SBF1_4240002 [Candidatus Desulfosporosinus infrequens]
MTKRQIIKLELFLIRIKEEDILAGTHNEVWRSKIPKSRPPCKNKSFCQLFTTY